MRPALLLDWFPLRAHRLNLCLIMEKFEAFVKFTQQSTSKNVEDRSSRVFTSQSQQGSGIHRDIAPKENASCQLLHWYLEDEVVAEGRIASMDLVAKVHHMVLGKDCWKIWVEEVYMDHLALYRPTEEFRVLRDAFGSTVAWPKSSVKLL